ncbi:MAG TPA: AbrB/MazE/SpoVT family DNA-binding domain-containing protein [Stellaceae bacterium]|nr:AbrB/MazE/SpoVT family DNA-binding domain-containing protein [Stellaceae bacterium]
MVPDTVVRTRLGIKAQIVLPKPVRDALGLKPGDALAFVIHGHEVKIIPIPAAANDPFACFTEWASEADRKGYADL